MRKHILVVGLVLTMCCACGTTKGGSPNVTTNGRVSNSSVSGSSVSGDSVSGSSVSGSSVSGSSVSGGVISVSSVGVSTADTDFIVSSDSGYVFKENSENRVLVYKEGTQVGTVEFESMPEAISKFAIETANGFSGNAVSASFLSTDEYYYVFNFRSETDYYEDLNTCLKCSFDNEDDFKDFLYYLEVSPR